MRDGKYIIWHRAQPLLVSEYPYGGPQHRMPLVEAGKIDYQTELPPEGLKRVTTSKDKKERGGRAPSPALQQTGGA